MSSQTTLAEIDDARGEIADLRRQLAEMTATALAGTPDAGFLQGLLASSDDCVKVLDLDGKLLFMSENGKRAMEVDDFDAIAGCPWPDLWKDHAQGAAQAAVAAARDGGVGRFEGEALTLAGTPKWWDVQVTAILGADRRPARLLAVSRDITARRLADEEARRLAGLVEQSRDFIAVTGASGQILFVNQAGREMVGLSSLAAAREQPPLDYVAPEHHERVIGTVMPHVRAHGFWEGELNLRCFATGALRPMLFNVFPLRDAAGRFTGYGTVSRDLREARKSDRRRFALLELGDRLRTMTDLNDMSLAAAEIVGVTLGIAGAGYGTIGADGAICTVERDWTAPGVASVVGRHHLEDYGYHVDRLRAGEVVVVADTWTDSLTSRHQAAFNAIHTRAFVNLPLLEHGRMVALFFAIHVEPRTWTEEEVGFVRNVTERTRSAIERRRAEGDLLALAASLERQVAERTADRNRLWQLSTDIMLVARFDGVIMAVNPAWTRVLGYTDAEVLGQTLFGFIHPDDLTRMLAGAASLSDGSTLQQFENRYMCKDGGFRWISWTAVPGDGLINAVGRDITAERQQAEALQQAEERLRQSLKMEAVGQLTGGLAHDFNNLLTVVDGSLELLGTRLTQGRRENLGRYIEAAQGASKRAAALTHRLLAFSRRQTLDPKPTDVNRLVAGIQELIGRTVGPAIVIDVVADGALWGVRIDPNQLENALLNLCINARDAMPDGGRLVIETTNVVLDVAAAAQCELPPGEYVTLAVTDSGTGMPPEVIARVFDPFFTTKPLGQGTGLGLSMIYGFARQSGGQVRIESVVGRGTTMRLLLPRYLGAAEAVPVPARINASRRAVRGETVLVVDDEATVRMLVAEVLADLGYVPIEAADGPGGLAALQAADRVDLLVTDLGLPGPMNGRQMADAARVAYPELKILFITGYAESAAVRNGGLDPGMHVLTKPFALDALTARIKDLLGD